MNTKPTPAARPRASAATTITFDDAPVTPDQAIETPAPTDTPAAVTFTPPEDALMPPADAPLAVTSLTLTSPTATQGIKIMINNNVDFAAIGKQNLEAFTASSKIWTAGVQDLTKQFATTAKASLEESVAAFKALSSVKSIKEAIDLQSAYSKSVIAKTVAESTKFTDASRKLTEQALAPITARFSDAVGGFGKAA